MEVRVEADGCQLPECSYISVRVGDLQKQTLYDPKKVYKFPEARRFGKIDMYQRIGTCELVWAADEPETRSCRVVRTAASTGDAATDPKVAEAGDASMRLKVFMSRPRDENKGGDGTVPQLASAGDPPTKAKEVSALAKKYLAEHDIEGIFTGAMRALLKAMPEDAPSFICNNICSRYDVKMTPLEATVATGQQKPEAPALPQEPSQATEVPSAADAAQKKIEAPTAAAEAAVASSGALAEPREELTDSSKRIASKSRTAQLPTASSSEKLENNNAAALEDTAGSAEASAAVAAPTEAVPSVEAAEGKPEASAAPVEQARKLSDAEQKPRASLVAMEMQRNRASSWHGGDPAAEVSAAKAPDVAPSTTADVLVETPTTVQAAATVPVPTSPAEEAAAAAESAVEAAMAAEVAARSKKAIPELREEVGSLLVTAAQNGILQNALSEVSKVTSLRELTRDAFIAASSDGTLQRALSEFTQARVAADAAEKPPAPNVLPEIEELRVEAREALVKMSADGSLQAALRTLQGSAEASKPSQDIDALRVRARGVLMNADSSGTLEAAMRRVRDGEWSFPTEAQARSDAGSTKAQDLATEALQSAKAGSAGSADLTQRSAAASVEQTTATSPSTGEDRALVVVQGLSDAAQCAVASNPVAAAGLAMTAATAAESAPTMRAEAI